MAEAFRKSTLGLMLVVSGGQSLFLCGMLAEQDVYSLFLIFRSSSLI